MVLLALIKDYLEEKYYARKYCLSEGHIVIKDHIDYALHTHTYSCARCKREDIVETEKIKMNLPFARISFKKGQFHNEVGPAVYYQSYDKRTSSYINIPLFQQRFNVFHHAYWLNGEKYSKAEWFSKLTSEQQIKAMMNSENFE